MNSDDPRAGTPVLTPEQQYTIRALQRAAVSIMQGKTVGVMLLEYNSAGMSRWSGFVAKHEDGEDMLKRWNEVATHFAHRLSADDGNAPPANRSLKAQ